MNNVKGHGKAPGFSRSEAKELPIAFLLVLAIGFAPFVIGWLFQQLINLFL